MESAKRYFELLNQERDAKEALAGLNAVRPPVNELMNPEEQTEETAEWLDIFNYYTNRLNDIHAEMDRLEADEE